MTYIIPITIIFLNTFLGALSALFLKKSGNYKDSPDMVRFVKKKHYYLLLGLLGYGVGAVIYVITLKFAPVSILAPVSSATYIWTYILARKHLDEHIGLNKIMGLSLIIIGIIVISFA